ncbi:MAG: hemin uptake protein HemP [Pseudomonadota bacterium]
MKHEIIFNRTRPLERPQPAAPQYTAEDLTEGGRKAHITLNDQIYTLQITKQGKLLLTK